MNMPTSMKFVVCLLSRQREGMGRSANVLLNVGKLLKKTVYLENPPKWTFCTIRVRWTDHFKHSGVVGLTILMRLGLLYSW